MPSRLFARALLRFLTGCLTILLPGMACGADIAADMATVKSRVIANQTDPSVSTSTVSSLRSTLAAEGTWPGIDYASTAATNWSPSNHLSNLRVLARAYAKPGSPFAGDAILVNEILRAYDAWISRDPKSTNWWYNEISSPQMLGEIMLLIEGNLSAGRKTSGLSLVARAYVSRGTNSGTNTGANRTDRAYASMMRGLLMPDSALVSESFLSIGDTILVTTAEGIQPDQSYQQHGAQLYIGGYGQVYLSSVPLYGRWAAGTSFAFDPLQARVLTDLVLDGVQWYIRGDSLDFTSYGRGVTRANQAAVAAGFRTPITHVRAMGGGYRAAELDAFSARLNADLAAASASVDRALTGSRHFWRSDSTVHHVPDWSVFVKTSSVRTLQPESGNGEGLKNLHLADGVVLMMRDGNEYDGIMPVWNWRNLPGTTTEQGTYSLKPPTDWGMAGTSTLAGAAVNSTDAAVAYLHQRLNVTARKSWFLFDKRVIALGSGIDRPGGGAAVMTCVNDSLLRGSVQYSTNGTDAAVLTEGGTLSTGTLRWVHHDGIGYHFPAIESPAGLRLSSASRSGSWQEINTTQSAATVTRNVFSLQIDHGVSPTGGGYAYIAAPVGSASAMPDYPGFAVEIVRRDNTAHAVRDAVRGLTGVNFWQAGEAAGIVASAPACVLVNQDGSRLDVFLTDPAHAASGELIVDIAVPVAGTLHADSHLTTEVSSSGIRLRAARGMMGGRTLHASFFLRPHAYEIIELPAQADAYAYDAQPNQSYGTNDILVAKLIDGSGYNRVSFLRFTVPALRAPAAGASLRLFPTAANGPGIHGLLPLDEAEWTETSLTWNNRPQPRAAPLALWLPVVNTVVNVDVMKAMPAPWAQGGTVGFSIAPLTRMPDGYVQYAAREHANAGIRPMLRLAVPRSELEIWRQESFGELANVPAVSGDFVDPDGDGLSNAIEFVLGTTAAPGLPDSDSSAYRPYLRPDPDAGMVVFSHRRSRLAPIDHVFIEGSADLLNWQRLNPGVGGVEFSVAPEPGDPAVERVEWRIPAGSTQPHFLRLAFVP